MSDEVKKPDELIKGLDQAEVTELDDASLEEVSGGLGEGEVPENGNCGNTGCCGAQV